MWGGEDRRAYVRRNVDVKVKKKGGECTVQAKTLYLVVVPFFLIILQLPRRCLQHVGLDGRRVARLNSSKIYRYLPPSHLLPLACPLVNHLLVKAL